MTPAPTRRRRMCALWTSAGMFGLLTGLFCFLVFSAMDAGSPPDQRMSTVWKAVPCTVLALASGACFGLLMRSAVGRTLPPPPGATMATRRAASRAVRRRRPTGGPLVDETARITARNILRQSPWWTLRLPLIGFLVGFAANTWAILERFPWPGGVLTVPWTNLLGFAFFLFLLTVALPLSARGRKDAQAFLESLSEAEREGRTPEADR
ncbi:hypothetical protein [Nocardiopsis sp. CC223A]|uniref:hypothetical protein n=1 Tax=Nocardiopsis sp. CC223A TaxID=3044051 RepID=UPI00278C0D05|nr:hypothetical protein [Nocardiopsis sp. CC223A]